MNIESSRKAQQIAKTTLQNLTTFIRPGVNEQNIADHAEFLMRKRGVSEFWYHGVAALILVGKRTLLSVSGREYSASSNLVKEGDLVTVNLSPVIDGHWADCARSYVVDKERTFIDFQNGIGPLQEGFQAEEYLHKKLIDIANEKSTFNEVYFLMNEEIKKLGFKNLDFNSNLGHSIETDINKRRYLKKDEHTRLGEVHCFTFEPHIQNIKGGFGFKKENIYYFEKGKLLEL